MDQKTHTWIALRAIALLEQENKVPNLVCLLKPHAAEATVGAWIPDMADAKRGGAGNKTENHVLKIKKYSGNQSARFTQSKDQLLQEIGKQRKIAQYLRGDQTLDDAWWANPYCGDVPKPGQHLPNRVMALSTMLKDILLLGNEGIDELIPGSVGFLKDVGTEVRTTESAAAMYFFMLSHFAADACMPCHCDDRPLALYENGLHMEMEKHWSEIVGPAFDKEKFEANNGQNLSSKELFEEVMAVDGKFNLAFDGVAIPGLPKGHDEWLESMYLCRASFAIARIIAPDHLYPESNPQARAPFNQVLANKTLLECMDQMIMFDAVLNTAIFWKHIWNKVSHW